MQGILSKLLGLLSTKPETKEPEALAPEHSEAEPVYFRGHDDPQIAEANRAAQQTFKYFWREVSWERSRIVPALEVACVKFAFADESPPTKDSRFEHMWLDDVDFDGVQVSGNLVNSPNWLKSVELGQRVARPIQELGDWMFAMLGKAYGAHTVNVLRSRMSAEELRAHDEAWGLDFGEDFGIRLARSDTPEGLEAVLRDHPMAINCEEKIREQLKANPSMLRDISDDGWTVLHHQSLAGNRNIVRLLLELGADPFARIARGETPRQLAEAIGWDETAALLLRAEHS